MLNKYNTMPKTFWSLYRNFKIFMHSCVFSCMPKDHQLEQKETQTFLLWAWETTSLTIMALETGFFRLGLLRCKKLIGPRIRYVLFTASRSRISIHIVNAQCSFGLIQKPENGGTESSSAFRNLWPNGSNSASRLWQLTLTFYTTCKL